MSPISLLRVPFDIIFHEEFDFKGLRPWNPDQVPVLSQKPKIFMKKKMSPISLLRGSFDSIFSGEFDFEGPRPWKPPGTRVLTLQNFHLEGHITPSEGHIHHQGHLPHQRVGGSGGALKSADPACMGERVETNHFKQLEIKLRAASAMPKCNISQLELFTPGHPKPSILLGPSFKNRFLSENMLQQMSTARKADFWRMVPAKLLLLSSQAASSSL